MGWSPFTMTRKVSSSQRIHCSYAAALRFLHEPVELIDLSPAVIRREASPGNPNFFIIHYKTVLFGRTSEFSYTANFVQFHDDGVDCEVQAPAGVRLKNEWRVRKVEGAEGENGEETVEVVEDVTVNTYFFLMPTTVSGLRNARKFLLENLAAKLEGRAETSAIRPEA